jgi:hypothetical protein
MLFIPFSKPKTDKMITDFIYANITPFSEGLAPVSSLRRRVVNKKQEFCSILFVERKVTRILISEY